MLAVVQLGVVREGGTANEEGWAWVESPEGQDDSLIEAYRLSELVRNTLRIEVMPLCIIASHLGSSACSSCSATFKIHNSWQLDSDLW